MNAPPSISPSQRTFEFDRTATRARRHQRRRCVGFLSTFLLGALLIAALLMGAVAGAMLAAVVRDKDDAKTETRRVAVPAVLSGAESST